MKSIFYRFSALVATLVLCASVSAETLLDGKKWTRTDLNTNKPSSGFMSGGMQGAAIYNGNLYQFRTNGASGVNYDVYNVSAGTWSTGKALTCLANSHSGSACFGTKVFKTTDGYTYNCTMPFLYVTNGQTIQIVDVENDKLVATWTLASALDDDAIAAYDFANGTLWSIGYVSGSRKAPYIVRVRTGIDFTSVPTDQTITFTDAEKTSVGGPDAEGIQRTLINGTIQDCQYVDGKIYLAAGGGSSAHRTEYCRVHVYDTSSKTIVETKMCTGDNEAEGLVYDASSNTFVMTVLGSNLWKLSAGSGYDTDNFEPATLNGEYYEISTPSQLLWFKQQVYGGRTDIKARLTADINMSGVTDPFSNYVYDFNIALAGKTTATYPATFAFRGELDGQSHTIKNYTITKTPYCYCGLFPYVIGANIHDVTVKGSIKLSTCDAMVKQSDGSWKAVSGQPVANVGLIGYMDGGTISNVNSYITIDTSVSSGVEGTINKLVGGTGSTAPTTTDCSTEDPSLKTHEQNGGNHYYENGFCVCTDAAKNNAGYYEAPVQLTPARCTELGIDASYATNGYYEVKNAGNMFYIAKELNSATAAGANNRNYVMTTDIDMAGDDAAHQDWVGIGDYNSNNDVKHYKGTFDGRGHKFTNFYMKVSADRRSLFNLINAATIKNFTISGQMDINGANMQIATVVSRVHNNDSWIEDIYSSVNITVADDKSPKCVGGIVGQVHGTTNLKRCRYSGTITAKLAKECIGGIIGQAEGKAYLTDCLFDGAIISTCETASTGMTDGARIGGMCGYHQNELYITNCLVKGTVTIGLAPKSAYSGIIVGSANAANKKLILSNTYYSTVGSTTDLPAIGYTNTNSSSKLTATYVGDTPNWKSIKTALNNGSTTWGINTQEYPVPGEEDATLYTVTYIANGGSECASVSRSLNTVITLPTPTKDGFVFAGWTVAADGTGTKLAGGASYTITDDVTLYAQWAATYTITFNTNGGSACDAVTKTENTVITLPTSTKSGYVLTGWNTKEDGSGTKYNAGASYTITADATLYAQWTEAYTITFNSKGGSACTSVTNVAGTQITLPTPTRDDYLFNNWNTQEDGSGDSYAAGATYTITATATLYAQWTLDETGDYRNGFHKTHAKTADDYYQEPVEVTAENRESFGLTSDYIGYYQVKNAGNMFWIAKNLSADNNTRKYVMTTDIDMAGNDDNHKDWAGISTWSGAHFKGTFDGNGHKFTHYYMAVSSGSIKGMFSTPEGATIKNFTISGDMYINCADNQMGVISGRIGGATTFEDIHSNVNIIIAGTKTPISIGGIVGQCSNPTTLNRCRYSGTITANSASTAIGGIFGNAENPVTLDNCLFDGTITSKSNQTFVFNDYGGAKTGVAIGGIGGVTNNKLTITNSLSIGTISVAQADDKTHSGIVVGMNGKTSTLTITNTYYRTTGSTSGVNAVGLNNATDQSAAAPTEITTQSWRTIKKKLNLEPAVGATVNWNIVEPTDYPIPMLNVEQEEQGTYYTIKFYDEASGNLLKEVQVLEEHDLEVPEEAQKTGYSVTWEPALVSPVTADASYYGTYTINSYTITYKSEGSKFAEQTYEYGAEVTAPAEKPTKGNGYVFDHWDPALPTTMPAKNLEVNAVFAEAPYEISTFAELKAFRDAVNSAGGATKNAKLTADINCGDAAFGEPIGVNTNAQSGLHSTPSNPYVGTFDGQGHKITGLNINSDGHFVGLFGYAGVGGNANKAANIKNLSVSGTINTTYSITETPSNCNQPHLGLIGCLMNGTVSGVTSSVSLTNSSCTPAQFGGIVGCTYKYDSKKTITNCAYTGTMTVDAWDCIGGILGYSQGGVEISNCYFGGKIVQTCTAAKNTLMGGIVGYLASGSESGRAYPITNNVSNGEMTITTTGTGNVKGVLFGKQAGFGNNVSTYVYGNYGTSGTLRSDEGTGTVKTMTMDEIAAQLGPQYYVDSEGKLSTGNVISVDAQKNYHLRYLYLEDLADAPTWPTNANGVKVNKVKYVRKGTYMTKGFISVCMPFALNASNLPGGENCKVKVFDQVKEENGANYVYFKDYKVSESSDDKLPVAAGTPVFLYLPEGEDGPRGKDWTVTINAADEETGIELTMSVTNPDDTIRGIYGTFTTVKTGVWSNDTPMYKIKSDGETLVKTTASSHCYPYRAYLKLPAIQNGSSASEYRLSFEDYATSIETVEEEKERGSRLYNLMGQPIEEGNKGLMIRSGKIILKR